MEKLNVFFEDLKPVQFKKKLFKTWINDLIVSESRKTGDINLIFCSAEYLLSINRQFLNHDYHTDIITFNYNEEEVISGDLFISIPQVKLNAVEYSQDFNVEISRVIFHGILHLIGYNDKQDDETIQMTQKENFYLKKFGIIQ